MSKSRPLNERAARQRPPHEALWHVDSGWAVFAGPLHHNAPHAHSTAVYLAGLYGSDFRLAGLDPRTMAGLLGGGAILGWLGSWIAASRHLRAIEPSG